MNAISYARVSTDVQDFERQVNQIREHCITNNLTLVKEFAEKESGKIKERPALTEMMNFVKESTDIDYLVVSELSRLGRTGKVLETLETLNQKKIGLVLLKEKITTLNPDKSVNHSSSLILSVLSSINSYELITTNYRSISGIKNSRIKGNAAGSYNIPYGYRKEKNKMLVIDDEESEIIKTIFNLYLNGNGTKKIANYLNDNNIPNRNKKIVDAGLNKKEYNFKMKWVDGTIYSLLTNRIYIGKRKHTIGKTKELKKDQTEFKRKFDYEEFDQPLLQIISNEQFKQVQDRLNNNYNKQGKHMKFNYLLDNKKIVCGICGQSYFPHKRSSGKDNRYICLSTRYKDSQTDKCANIGISIDKIDRLIQCVILFKFEEELKGNIDNKTLKEEIKSIENEIEKLNKELKKELLTEGKLVDLYSDGNISKDVYLLKIKPIQANQQSITNKIHYTTDKLNITKKAYSNVMDIKGIKYNFNKTNKQLPKNIVNTIINSIIINSIESAPQIYQDIYKEAQINNWFNAKQDRAILLTIISGLTKLYYIISQRENYVYDIKDKKIKYLDDIDTMIKIALGYEKTVELKYTDSATEAIKKNFAFDIFAVDLKGEFNKDGKKFAEFIISRASKVE